MSHIPPLAHKPALVKRLPAQAPTRRAWLAWAVAFVLPLLLILALFFPAARAAEAPPPDAFDYVIESFGPQFPISQGAWYSNPANGIGIGYYYLDISIPCGWPADRAISIDLYSPELTRNGASDEPRANGAISTTFELYAPPAIAGPGIAEPGPHAPASISQVSYEPKNGQASWVRFHTFPAPAACGSYILRSEARGDDGNVWRVRAGYDNDANPNNRPPSSYDNPDGVLGTGDEIAIGVIQTGFKHPQNPRNCLTLYEYVKPRQSQVVFHNFDMEGSGKVAYVSPSGQNFAGLASERRKWNNGTLTDRGLGDVVLNPEPGWWKLLTCAGQDTHFVQEGQQGVPAYFHQPPTPRMIVTKDDGQTNAGPNQLLTYTIAFTNTASGGPAPLEVPGAARKLTLTDPLPAHTIFQNCAIAAPLSGSCQLNGATVTFTIDGKLNAGATGRAQLVVKTAADAPAGPLRNDLTLDYQDDLGNPFSTTGSDTDQLELVEADLWLTKTVDQARPNVGAAVAFEVAIHNDGPATATRIQIDDQLPAGLEFVSGAADAGSYDRATGTWAIEALPAGGSARLVIVARVRGPAPITNTAQVRSVDQLDPDSTPGNADPREDDQASATVTPQLADLSLSKGVSQLSPQRGDALIYTITVANHGPDAATNLLVSDPLPAELAFGAATASQGSYDRSSGSWAVGTLAAGASATLQVDVTVLSDGKITNTAQVSAVDQFDPDSTPGNSNPAEDDQASVTTPIAATAVTLVSFTAARADAGVLIAWRTSAELNTWGFELYRSADGLRAHAVRITPEPVLARGRGAAGASYTWADTGAGAAEPASYWLVEIETSGMTNEYGPATAAPQLASGPPRLFLPLLTR